ncbi:MAG: hypothetical protein JNK54_01610 [Elusimicrobia bacterium]|jgi:uncharacterized protein YgbK (DUF1537 family)|nr:hypothetical protein [Elusimicrobiota bacterium]
MVDFRRVGVLADDFSGAGDVALAFEAAGFSTEIWAPVGGKPRQPDAGVRVWILDTESRGLPPLEAARRVRRALTALAPWKPSFIFKKIDSTLRGPVGAEVAAFVGKLRPDRPVPLVPAFPRMGRSTVGGRHFVEGVSLDRSAFGSDPRHPARLSRVEDIVALPEPFRARVWVPDVENDRQMAGVARRALAGRCAIGSAGFAAALAHGMAGKKVTRKMSGRSVPLVGPPVVGVVVGSAHPLTERQADRLKNGTRRGPWHLIERPLERGVPAKILHRVVLQARLMEKVHRIRRWVVTGGETAFALARLWRSARWRVVAAVESGVPVCRSVGESPRVVAIKPGGFGSEKALVRAVRFLSRKD